MDEQIQNNEYQNPRLDNTPIVIKKRSSIGRTIILILTVVVLMSGSAIGAFYLRNSQAVKSEKQQSDSIENYKKTIATLEKQIAGTTNITPENSPTICTNIAPDATTIENIKASITSGNTAALEGYMASNVNIIPTTPEGDLTKTPTQAITDISGFISSDINSWDYNFALTTATINTYKQSNYSKYFTDTSLIGKATNEKVISFSFNCLGEINTVFLTSSPDLI